MAQSSKMLCTVCARGGSVGLAGKNIRQLHGIPLIGHTLNRARECGEFADIAVSSDSDEILLLAERFGATVLVKRPPELSSATAPKIPAIRHCLLAAEQERNMAYDAIWDLDCTAPLRTVDDIRNAVQLLASPGCTNVVSGHAARKSPYFNIVELNASGIVHLSKTITPPVMRRQDAPECYELNGSIYGWWRDRLIANDTLYLAGTRLYCMPAERAVDIDDELDFKLVELLLQKG